ncbi:hypothetical protein Tco_0076745 [Tanacetum coccineum]
MHRLVLRGEATLEKECIVAIMAKKVTCKKNATRLLVILLVTHSMEKFNPQNNSNNKGSEHGHDTGSSLSGQTKYFRASYCTLKGPCLS